MSCFSEPIRPQQHHYCPCLCVVQCGSCNSVLSHSFVPTKQCPSLFGLVLLDFYCLVFAGCVCVCVIVCVCVWPFLTLAHAQWDFTETVGCYDYKLASVLIRFRAVKGGGFYSVSLSGTKGGSYSARSLKRQRLTTFEADSKNSDEVKWSVRKCSHGCGYLGEML